MNDPLEKKTDESAEAASGTRLVIRSHSDAPTRRKRMPARARRYCPVMVQVHRRWTRFSRLILNIRRAHLRPRAGYKPGTAGVHRMNRQASRDVATTVIQLAVNA